MTIVQIPTASCFLRYPGEARSPDDRAAMAAATGAAAEVPEKGLNAVLQQVGSNGMAEGVKPVEINKKTR